MNNATPPELNIKWTTRERAAQIAAFILFEHFPLVAGYTHHFVEARLVNRYPHMKRQPLAVAGPNSHKIREWLLDHGESVDHLPVG